MKLDKITLIDMIFATATVIFAAYGLIVMLASNVFLCLAVMMGLFILAMQDEPPKFLDKFFKDEEP